MPKRLLDVIKWIKQIKLFENLKFSNSLKKYLGGENWVENITSSLTRFLSKTKIKKQVTSVFY